jgi:hypothetical protein
MNRVESAEEPQREADKSSAPASPLSSGAVDQVLSGSLTR